MTEVTTTVAPVTRRVLTTAEKIEQLTQRIAKDQATLAALQSEAAAAAALADVGAGYTVTFALGRAETKRELSGTVLARGLINDKDSVKVLVGEGIDANVYSVAVSTLSAAVAPGAVAEVAEPVAEEAAPEVAPEAGSEVDDLLNGVNL